MRDIVPLRPCCVSFDLYRAFLPTWAAKIVIIQTLVTARAILLFTTRYGARNNVLHSEVIRAQRHLRVKRIRP